MSGVFLGKSGLRHSMKSKARQFLLEGRKRVKERGRKQCAYGPLKFLERATGFEPATFSLGS